MTTSVNLTNHFLIAMPALNDPNFFHTVTLICDHNEEGAMGLVINRPLDLNLGEMLQQLELETANTPLTRTPIYQGGPVQPERGFVLHSPAREWEATVKVSDDLALTMSQDIIHAIAEGKGPQHYLIALGYAGWGKDQLEGELAANAWLSGPADKSILFELPVEQRWAASAALIGVELNLISSDIGHA